MSREESTVPATMEAALRALQHGPGLVRDLLARVEWPSTTKSAIRLSRGLQALREQNRVRKSADGVWSLCDAPTDDGTEEVVLLELDATVRVSVHPLSYPWPRTEVLAEAVLGPSWPPGTRPPPRYATALTSAQEKAGGLPAARAQVFERQRHALAQLRQRPANDTPSAPPPAPTRAASLADVLAAPTAPPPPRSPALAPEETLPMLSTSAPLAAPSLPAPAPLPPVRVFPRILIERLLAYCASVEGGARAESVHSWLKAQRLSRVQAEELLEHLVTGERLACHERPVAGGTVVVRYLPTDPSVEPAPLPVSSAPAEEQAALPAPAPQDAPAAPAEAPEAASPPASPASAPDAGPSPSAGHDLPALEDPASLPPSSRRLMRSEEETRAAVLGVLGPEGKSRRLIAELTELPYTTVSGLVRRLIASGEAFDSPNGICRGEVQGEAPANRRGEPQTEQRQGNTTRVLAAIRAGVGHSTEIQRHLTMASATFHRSRTELLEKKLIRQTEYGVYVPTDAGAEAAEVAPAPPASPSSAPSAPAEAKAPVTLAQFTEMIDDAVRAGSGKPPAPAPLAPTGGPVVLAGTPVADVVALALDALPEDAVVAYLDERRALAKEERELVEAQQLLADRFLQHQHRRAALRQQLVEHLTRKAPAPASSAAAAPGPTLPPTAATPSPAPPPPPIAATRPEAATIKDRVLLAIEGKEPVTAVVLAQRLAPTTPLQISGPLAVLRKAKYLASPRHGTYQLTTLGLKKQASLKLPRRGAKGAA